MWRRLQSVNWPQRQCTCGFRGFWPLNAGTRIPTAALAEQFKAGDSVPVPATEYGASEEAVCDAIRCELDLKAA
jgi:hypothetical protein